MNFRKKIKVSKFILSCIFLTGYAAYAVYALYYYLTFRSALGIALLCLIGVALTLSFVITFLSYRINLREAPRPKLHRFIKMAKYLVQLVCSAIALGFVFSAVHVTNVFSLIMASISIPFLIWSFFVNVIVEYFERKFASGFGKKVFVPQTPKDEEGNALDLSEVISQTNSQKKVPMARTGDKKD